MVTWRCESLNLARSVEVDSKGLVPTGNRESLPITDLMGIA